MIKEDDVEPHYVWHPLTIDETRAIFEPLAIRWWVAGGWAIDLHLGGETREHADIDVSILRADHCELRALFDAFELHVAHDGTLTPWSGDELPPEHHQFWARRRGDEAWAFEVLLEYHAGDTWLYRRDHRIVRPVDRLGRRDAHGVPYIAPEVALLYKSKGYDIARNAADFASALPTLTHDERAWLSDSLTVTAPDHPWIEALTG